MIDSAEGKVRRLFTLTTHRKFQRLLAKMDQALRARRASQRWITTLGSDLITLIESVRIEQVQEIIPSIKIQREEFSKHLEKYELCQQKVEETIDEDRLDSDILETNDFKRKNVLPILLKFEEILSMDRNLGAENQNVNNNAAASSHHHHRVFHSAKLPKIELPSFEGDVREWTSFWEVFEVLVDRDTTLEDISKFLYLQSALKGDANKTISGLSLNAANYQTAKELLTGRYGRKETIIFTHVQDLLVLGVAQHPTIRQMWDFYDLLQSHVRSLAALGISGDEYGVILTPLVLSRLPAELRMEWARVGESHESDLKHLMNFLKAEIERRERSQVFAPETDAEMPATGSMLSSSSSSSSSTISFSRVLSFLFQRYMTLENVLYLYFLLSGP